MMAAKPPKLGVIDGGRRGGPADAPPPEDARRSSPIVPLGHRDGRYVLLDARGQFRVVPADKLASRAVLADLSGGEIGWLEAFFPRTDRDGNRTEGFAVARASEWIMRECSLAGLWGETPIREPGLWAGRDGRPVLHCGDVVMRPGEGARLPDVEPPPGYVARAAGFRDEEAVWPRAARIARPAPPADQDVARELLADLHLWRWRHAEAAPLLVLGWLGTALLGAAAPWRPNLFLLGEPGSGKSRLMDLLRAAMPVHEYSNDCTKAGMEQTLNGRPRPILLDESEGSNAGASALLTLVRVATGGEGAQGRRGSPGGASRAFSVLGAVCMAATAPPDMQPQDVSRFCVVDLLPPEPGADSSARIADAIARAAAAGPALWGRVVGRFGLWRDAYAAFRAGVVTVSGGPRQADQLGALLAGWWVLTQDAAPHPEDDVIPALRLVDPFLRSPDEVETEGGPRRCLAHLLTSVVSTTVASKRASIGDLVDGAFAASDHALDAQIELRMLGIKPEAEHGLLRGLWIGNRARPIEEIYRGSPWDGGRWRYELLRLPGARPSGKTVRIGRGKAGAAMHAIWLPEEVFLDASGGGEGVRV